MSSSFGFNTGYVDELYTLYLENPESVSESWREFFADYRPGDAFTAPESRSVPSGDGEQAVVPTPAVAPRPEARPAKAPEKETAREDAVERKPLRGVAARIVENMESSLSLPTATSFRHVPVRLMAENRQLINDYQRKVGGNKVSYTHLIAWALVQALRALPNMNTAYARDNGSPLHLIPPDVNLGLAIDLEKKDGSRTLLVPNVKGADKMNFALFVNQYNDLVRRARAGSLDVADFAGTTVTLTNPGMIGTAMSVPRLMPGQGLIVAVGAIGYPPEYSGVPNEVLGRLGLSEVMTITSTYDHRVIQGAESGAFLSHVAELLTGEHRFFHDVFADLGIPISPFVFPKDSSPVLGQAGTAGADVEIVQKQTRVRELIRSYRVRGHLLADLNPLGYEPSYHPELDPATYGLTIWDLDRDFYVDGLGGKENLPLREILNILKDTYTRKVGIEFMHISDPIEKRWLTERIEPVRMGEEIEPEHKRRILHKLNAAEAFERFLHTKYVGHKRFSLEGAETLIPLLDTILTDAIDQEVKEVVIGMAHRGRLNVLANILGKPYNVIFSEFEGSIDPNTIQGSGDVKYHLGSRGVYPGPNEGTINLTLASNPSHLEAVSPVVEGMTRAKQELIKDPTRDLVLPLLIHGDAAFAGQGVVAETLNLSQLKGYKTGGTIHIVVNNQIGFTTSPEHARSSLYATDIARMIQAPIFHVNGDDPEAAVRVARLALDYRQVFNKDVVIDMVCYRLHGHNEADEPAYTQPILYRKIEGHRSVRKRYTETLMRRGDLNPEEAEQMLDDYRDRLQEAFDKTKGIEGEKPLAGTLEKKRKPAADAEPFTTAAPREDLEAVVRALVQFPQGFQVHPKLLRQFERRGKLFEERKIDWAFAEALAFGTLLLEGTPIRLSGQDSRRGTFSHRHAVVYDFTTGQEYIPLNDIRSGQAQLQIFDSLLSEYAVLGFEYGYSVADPATLVLWEAQFGDFSNGAQIVYDQFISAAEEKWGQTSGLVSLLPHGYEGQGPEHSSARLERFLQLCAEDNMQVCNITSPANYFHALRRQMKRKARKPLIIMAPKSLLRHPMAVSTPEEFAEGGVQELIPAGADPARTERLLFCSGKIYYDLVQEIEARGGLDGKIGVARVEQLYPFPEAVVREEIGRYEHLKRVVWVQEEAANMGAWAFVRPHFDTVLEALGLSNCPHIRYVGRDASASPASGSAKVHAQQHEKLIHEALAL